MSEFSPAERDYMRRALSLAGEGLYTARPNPRVGCVLVKSGQVVGEGWHRKAGEAHAEINALQNAGSAAAGAVAYVSLEPCAHEGRTPPCADALVKAGVSSVVMAMEDPNPSVSGRGAATLRRAGIDVRSGLLEQDARRLNAGFIKRMSSGRPFVQLKIAASLDGATAMASGESRWITGGEARHDVQRLRAAAGAVMTGVGTVLKDDPSLNVRDAALGDDIEPPRRVVLDSALRMPPNARMLALAGSTAVFCVQDGNRDKLEAAGADVIVVDAVDGRPNPDQVLGTLAQMEVNDVLVEAGPTLAAALLQGGYVDELVIYKAPHMMGSETRRMIDTPELTQLDQRIELDIQDVTMIGRDLKITAKPQS